MGRSVTSDMRTYQTSRWLRKLQTQAGGNLSIGTHSCIGGEISGIPREFIAPINEHETEIRRCLRRRVQVQIDFTKRVPIIDPSAVSDSLR